MVLAMSRPTKHPKTGVYQFRKAVPERLRPILGKTEVKRSLGTKDPQEAKRRHAEVSARIEAEWSDLERLERLKGESAKPIPHREIVALAGVVYRQWREMMADEPGEPDVWQHVIRLNGEAAEAGKLEEWFGPAVDRLLADHHLKIDEASRTRLLTEVAKAHTEAAEALQRQAEGDYRPDPVEARFPPLGLSNEARDKPAAKPVGKVGLTELLEGWWIEAKATGRTISTYESYRSTIEKLKGFLGHDDASRVTEEDVIAFKDMRLKEVNPRTNKPISPKTVKDSDLTALKSVFAWAMANRKLPSNPAKDVTVKIGKKVKLREKSLTDAEAAAVFKHALNYQGKPREGAKVTLAKRWVPLLCAYTGARLGEMVQLRKQDVRLEGGIWVLTITPEAGTVKDKEVREVPLHEHLVELGFPAMVGQEKGTYLFLDEPRNEADLRGKWQTVKNRVSEFVREVVTDKDVAPNHGWRHRFKTVGMDAGIDGRVLDAICGHAPSTVGEAYGNVTLKAKADAMARMPRVV